MQKIVQVFMVSLVITGLALAGFLTAFMVLDTSQDTGDGEKFTFDDFSFPEQDEGLKTKSETLEEEPIPQINNSWDSWRDSNDPGMNKIQTRHTTVNSTFTEHILLQQINDYRDKNGLERWHESQFLASVSRAHSYDQYQRDFYSHTNPDGEKPWDRARGVNGPIEQCTDIYGENLVQLFIDTKTQFPNNETKTLTTASDAANMTLALWKDSPDHNDLLLSETQNTAGIGVYMDETKHGSGYTGYVTLNTCQRDVQN